MTRELERAVGKLAREARFLLIAFSSGFHRFADRGQTYSEPEQILAEIRRANALRRIHIHTVALLSGAFTGKTEVEDAAAATDFLRRLALQNRGQFREIR